jgi:hypothetical protein
MLNEQLLKPIESPWHEQLEKEQMLTLHPIQPRKSMLLLLLQ